MEVYSEGKNETFECFFHHLLNECQTGSEMRRWKDTGIAEQPECTKELPWSPGSKKAPQSFCFQASFSFTIPFSRIRTCWHCLIMLTHYFHYDGLKSNPKFYFHAGVCKCQPWLQTFRSMGATSSLASHPVPRGTFQNSIWCRWSSWAPKTTCPHSRQAPLRLESRSSAYDITDDMKVNNLCMQT